jgi:transcriptional regulator of acetoin/glycerol metabolism
MFPLIQISNDAHRELRRAMLLDVLIATEWNLTHAAELLKLSGAAGVLREITILGLKSEYLAARRSGVIVVGGHRKRVLRPPVGASFVSRWSDGVSRVLRASVLRAVLEHHAWNLTRAAQTLGLAGPASVMRMLGDAGLSAEYQRARRDGRVSRSRRSDGRL